MKDSAVSTPTLCACVCVRARTPTCSPGLRNPELHVCPAAGHSCRVFDAVGVQRAAHLHLFIAQHAHTHGGM